MHRIALGLSYDGQPWRGWQSQPCRNTVQDTLEAALTQFTAGPVSTICAGRTDTGVHALEQVVHLDTTAHRSNESWVRGLNALLPASIAVQWAQPVADDFHARFSARMRHYVYVVRGARVRSPLLHGRVGWVFRPLALAPMQEAALILQGEHDFSAFRAAQCQAASPVRHLHRLDIQQRGDFFLFQFSANAFLHHMIRNLMGTLLYVGQGRQPVQWVADVLEQKQRSLAAPTFDAAGLYLAGVNYDPVFNLPVTTTLAHLEHLCGHRFE
ncbi:tRNA pseudouridine(38-40) synthase TruA [Alcaligenes endophyticus]|uniref:tRNA pseudouridine synthase A n=1 Tax=Alcaligenes endophyticus TaxID=1929088 RepID=A0ABT8EK43_9BURK|nr:tRNA pseudouridine(38-40) synthase TruA [Alcaligenes endophyticus]MCX5591983.1 tRNA pseudouridine(38-40) synthase TruA [Alcaligenes endophyticus]MDN4121673.1 tRNA pseudouridine(38-40) synthase TruA [Alcaligenes endophyticus]